jgi:membrane-associated phospholipid phosphatase
MAAGLLFDVVMPHRFAPPGRRDPFEPSYPSGHALRASTFLLAAGYLFAREELVSKSVAVGAATALVAAFGTDRLLLDRHWTSDVVAGWLAAIAIAGASVSVYEATRKPKPERRPRRKSRR